MFENAVITGGDMPRNLDLTSLRSFAAVADTGGVTRAAGLLNLTQSAVSMQVKRLEEGLGVELLDRAGRGVALTPAGEQLLSYARRMLALNDEVWGRLTAQEFEGEIRLGVPADIIFPAIPQVLKRCAAEFPRVRIKLISAPTRRLLAMFGRGECDAILTTEEECGVGGETLVELPLVWVGADNGTAWRRTPLPIAFCSNCIFRAGVIRALDAAGVDWELAVDSELDNAVEAAVSADLGVTALLLNALPRQTEQVMHGGALPALGRQRINLYVRTERMGSVIEAVVDHLRHAYGLIAPRAAVAA